MDAASQHGGRARLPVLLSRLACLGVFIVVSVSIFVGFHYWWSRDPALSFLTVGAEIIACFGLAVALARFPREWGKGLIGIGITLIAAAWCAATMFQTMDTSARAEAVARAQETPAYVFAKNAADTATTLLRARLERPEARPACNCPQTVAAWEAAEAAAINRLRSERDQSVQRMEDAIPVPSLNWFAISRGVGIELAKLFGFAAFWFIVGPIAVAKPTRQPFEVVECGLTTEPPTDNQPKRRQGMQWLAGFLGFGVVSTQQMPPTAPSIDVVEPPAYRPVVTLSGRALSTAANQMAAKGLGERQIANQLSQQTGQRVTRHRVRVLLGREDRIAA